MPHDELDCSGVFCHSAFERLALDGSLSLDNARFIRMWFGTFMLMIYSSY